MIDLFYTFLDQEKGRVGLFFDDDAIDPLSVDIVRREFLGGEEAGDDSFYNLFSDVSLLLVTISTSNGIDVHKFGNKHPFFLGMEYGIKDWEQGNEYRRRIPEEYIREIEEIKDYEMSKRGLIPVQKAFDFARFAINEGWGRIWETTKK